MYKVKGSLGSGRGNTDDAMQDYLALAGDWVIETDENYVVQYCSKSNRSKDDLLPEFMYNKYFPSLLSQPGAGQLAAFMQGHQYFTKGPCSDYYVSIQGHYYQLRMLPFLIDGTFAGYRINMRMASDPAQERDVLKMQYVREQELITTLAQSLSNTDDFDTYIENAFLLVGVYMNLERINLFQCDPETHTISCIHNWHAAGLKDRREEVQSIPYDPESEEFRQLLSLPYISVPDVADLPVGEYEIPKALGVKSFVRFPIKINNELWGFAAVDSCNTVHHWSLNELNLMQTIHGIIISVIKTQLIETELARAFSALQGVLKSNPGAIWCLDNDYKATLCEGQLIRELGIDPQKAIGYSLRNVTSYLPDGAHNLLQRAQLTFQEGPQSYVTQLGDRYLTCNTSLLYDKKGAVTGQLGIVLDITDLHNMQQKLERAMEEAQQANLAKSEFLSRMSHEIRTPMNAIVGMNTIARGTKDIEKIEYCLEKIGSASRQMLDLINDVLDISKIEANKFELVASEFDFEQMLANVCNVINIRAEEKGINFTIDFDEMFSRSVICDELRLSQVFVNLLNNAVKFTPEQGNVTLKISHVPLDDDRFTLYVKVIDNGIGISESKRNQLFDPFEQADGSITRHFGGTGLGLTICKKIITLMHGDISVDSVEGQGSVFSFHIDAIWGKPLQKLTKHRKLDQEGIRVLVVDDSEDVRMYFSSTVESFGLQCHTANSGLQAIQYVEEAMTQGLPYTLIFIDWMMPGYNGIETARHILSLVQEESIVIMISVADWSDIEKEASAIGVTKFLSKPVLPSVLLDAITQWTSTSIVLDTPGEMAANADWTGKRLMLAEDIDINQEIIVCILADTGIHIDCVETGKEAYDLFLQDPSKYHAILMDVQMPDMDGMEATRKIRESGVPHAHSIPIIAMTAHAFQEDVDRCLEAGMDDHISKPVDVDDLMTKLSVYLHRTTPD